LRPLFLFQSGVEPPHSKRAARAARRDKPRSLGMRSYRHLSGKSRRDAFGVRSLETAFPFPRLRLQSGVEPPHSKRAARAARRDKPRGLGVRSYRHLSGRSRRDSFGVRSLETAFPFPRLRLQSGVEPPHSKRAARAARRDKPRSLEMPSSTGVRLTVSRIRRLSSRTAPRTGDESRASRSSTLRLPVPARQTGVGREMDGRGEARPAGRGGVAGTF
jgi:hypothetical protein